MALIICPECGKEFSDKAPACPNCGCPISEMYWDDNVQEDSFEDEKPKKYSTFHRLLYGNNANAKEAWQNADKVHAGQLCPICSSHNIEIHTEDIGEKYKGRSEVREKSALTRAGNKAGRAAMIGMTGGLWALTPKKSDYSEVKKGKSKIIKKRVAYCRDCGNQWTLH